MKATSNRFGFTMVELLVVVVLGAFLLLGVMQIFLGTLRGGERARSLAEVRQAGDFAMLSMERMIREGKDIVNCSGSNLTIDYVDGTQKIYSLSSGSISVDGDAITGNDVVVTTLLFTCTETNDGFVSDKVSIVMEMRPESGNPQTEEFRSTVSLRNL